MPEDESVTSARRSFEEVERPLASGRFKTVAFPYDTAAIERIWAEQPIDALDETPPTVRHETQPSDKLLQEILLAHFDTEIRQLALKLDESALSYGITLSLEARQQIIEQGLRPVLYGLYARSCASVYLTTFGDINFLEAVVQRARSLKAEVLRTYPRVAERYALLAATLIKSTQLMFSRFQADYPRFYGHVVESIATPEIVGIELLGESHGEAGCTTCITLRTIDGALTKVLYKPRDLRVDSAFYSIAGDMAHRADMNLYRPGFLRGKDYGWMEYVKAIPCTSAEEVSEYYQRLGWMTALVYALNGRDIHAGNVIACAQNPVLVDLECLLSPELACLGPRPPNNNLVTATGMVPMARFNHGDRGGLDASAFSGGGGGAHVYHDWCIVDVSTSRPRAARVAKRLEQQANVPRLNGRLVNPFAYSREYLCGFEAGYKQILAERELLLADDGPLAQLAEVELRVIVRNTSEYLKALYESTAPNLLTAIDQEDKHYRSFLRSATPPILDAEVSALIEGIVPRFVCSSGGGTLATTHRSDSTRLPSCRSGYDDTLNLITKGLCQQDLAEQLSLLKHCIGVMWHNNTRTHPRQPSLAGQDKSAPEDLATKAMALIDQHMLTGNAPDWLSCEVSRAGALVATRMPFGLCTGKAGVLAAYAHMYACDGNERYRAIVDTGLTRLRTIDLTEPSLATTGLNGLGGLVYLEAFAESRCKIPSDPRRMSALLERLRDGSTRTVASGLQGTGGDLVLLAAIHRLRPSVEVCQLARDLAMKLVGSPRLAKLLCEDVAGEQTQLDSWSGSAGALLCLMRYAAAFDDDVLARRCREIAQRLQTQSTEFFQLLLRARLLIECDSAADPVLVTQLVQQLEAHAQNPSLGSQYGLGALLVTIPALEAMGGNTSLVGRKILRLYLSRAQSAIELVDAGRVPRTHFMDLARGYAGIVLRASNVRGKSQWPSPLMV